MSMRDLIDGAMSDVLGHAQTVDVTTFLADPLSESGLTVSVLNASQFSRGIVQVDDELMLVSEVDKTSNTLALRYATARGLRGSGATTHAVGALVTMSPSVPRFRAVEAVAETLRSSSGLFRVSSQEFPYESARAGYAMPDDAKDVLSVTWLPPGPQGDWFPVRRWTWDQHNRQVVLGEPITSGRTVRVVYSADPLIPGQDEDFSETGLPQSCSDVIRFGAAWRLMSFVEPHNLMVARAEAEAMDRGKTPGSRVRVAQYLYGMYQQRLQEEVSDLQRRYPIRQHFAGRY